jgi:tetratricopeptide (TPR) repeat protein
MSYGHHCFFTLSIHFLTTSLFFSPIILPCQNETNTTPPFKMPAQAKERINFKPKQDLKTGPTPKPNHNCPSAGVRRILIELEDYPDSAQKYAGRYQVLVDKTIAFLKTQKIPWPVKSDDSLSREYKQMEFFNAVGNFMFDSLKIEYSDMDHRLWTVFTKEEISMDCDRMSFFVYDVGRALHFKIGMFFLRWGYTNHVIVAMEDYAFDPVENHYFSRNNVSKKYTIIYNYSENPETVQSITYHELVWYWQELNDINKALQCATLAYMTNPKNPELLLELGTIYSDAGDYSRAYECYRLVKKQLPLSDPQQYFQISIRDAVRNTNNLKIFSIQRTSSSPKKNSEEHRVR